MNTNDFLRTDAWLHRRREVFFEILAVCLPVLLYALATAASHVTDKHLDLHYFMGIPDALFGGCILFALTVIQAFGFRESGRIATLKAAKTIGLWGWLALAGLIVCSSLSLPAVIYHPEWALPLGLLSIYLGALGYKSVVLCRTYLSTALLHERPSHPS